MTVQGNISVFVQTDLVKDKGKGEIGLNEDLIESGIIDSLGIQKLIAFLETRFSIEISDDELIPDNFETISAICSFVEGKSKRA